MWTRLASSRDTTIHLLREVLRAVQRQAPRHATSEQTELFSAALGLCEMIRSQFQAALVEPQFFAGDLEPPPDHPGHRAGTLHPGSPLRVVVATVPHVADQSEYVTIAIRVIRHQPFAKEVAHLERQAQQDATRFPYAGLGCRL